MCARLLDKTARAWRDSYLYGCNHVRSRVSIGDVRPRCTRSVQQRHYIVTLRSDAGRKMLDRMRQSNSARIFRIYIEDLNLEKK